MVNKHFYCKLQLNQKLHSVKDYCHRHTFYKKPQRSKITEKSEGQIQHIS